MSQGSSDLWKHAHGYTPWALKLSLLALWALWSLHHPLGTQHSFPRMVDPTTNVLFSTFFKNSLGLYPYPFSNIDYNLLFLQLSYSLWASILTLQNLPVSSCIKPILAYFSTIQPYKSTLWCPPATIPSVRTAPKTQNQLSIYLFHSKVDECCIVLPLYDWLSLFAVLTFYEVSVTTELLNNEPLLLGEIEG